MHQHLAFQTILRFFNAIRSADGWPPVILRLRTQRRFALALVAFTLLGNAACVGKLDATKPTSTASEQPPATPDEGSRSVASIPETVPPVAISTSDSGSTDGGSSPATMPTPAPAVVIVTGTPQPHGFEIYGALPVQGARFQVGAPIRVHAFVLPRGDSLNACYQVDRGDCVPLAVNTDIFLTNLAPGAHTVTLNVSSPTGGQSRIQKSITVMTSLGSAPGPDVEFVLPPNGKLDLLGDRPMLILATEGRGQLSAVTLLHGSNSVLAASAGAGRTTYDLVLEIPAARFPPMAGVSFAALAADSLGLKATANAVIDLVDATYSTSMLAGDFTPQQWNLRFLHQLATESMVVYRPQLSSQEIAWTGSFQLNALLRMAESTGGASYLLKAKRMVDIAMAARDADRHRRGEKTNPKYISEKAAYQQSNATYNAATFAPIAANFTPDFSGPSNYTNGPTRLRLDSTAWSPGWSDPVGGPTGYPDDRSLNSGILLDGQIAIGIATYIDLVMKKPGFAAFKDHAAGLIPILRDIVELHDPSWVDQNMPDPTNRKRFLTVDFSTVPVPTDSVRFPVYIPRKVLTAQGFYFYYMTGASTTETASSMVAFNHASVIVSTALLINQFNGTYIANDPKLTAIANRAKMLVDFYKTFMVWHNSGPFAGTVTSFYNPTDKLPMDSNNWGSHTLDRFEDSDHANLDYAFLNLAYRFKQGMSTSDMQALAKTFQTRFYHIDASGVPDVYWRPNGAQPTAGYPNRELRADVGFGIGDLAEFDPSVLDSVMNILKTWDPIIPTSGPYYSSTYPVPPYNPSGTPPRTFNAWANFIYWKARNSTAMAAVGGN